MREGGGRVPNLKHNNKLFESVYLEKRMDTKILRLIAFFILITMFPGFITAGDFLNEQKKYKRVRDAISDKQNIIDAVLKNNNIDMNELNIVLVAYKAEKRLDIYAKNKQDKSYKRIAKYNVCRISGSLGPKSSQGDRQTPEGSYHIDRFNPASNFHLSLGINYPNESDKKRSKAEKLGGDIFIHGACATIGCLPMTDDKIKEIYLYAVYAKDNGQKKIPVYFFPFEMTESNFAKYKNRYSNTELINFWSELKKTYDSLIKEDIITAP